ncbi:MAG: HAMP domain-containing histidine kinase [Candidatus Eisenbacteria sp.]|nr:HAMP domain-containing histidine kinase [Candidatus Eisenbacteria bacterium]
MTRFLRARSLFWTFAGAFLAVLILGIVLQVLVIGVVLRPLADRWVSAHGELCARKVAQEISELPPTSSEDDIRAVLHSLGTEPGIALLFYRDSEGHFVCDRPIPPGVRHRMEGFLDSGEDIQPAMRDKGPGGRPWGPRHEGRALEIVARHRIDLESGATGEVIAMVPRRPHGFGLIPRHTSQPLLLYLPIAILLAGAAGLLMIRILLRRLRSLEELAARVTEGDLDARVPDPGNDEIGRLGGRFNRMTESLADARDRVNESDRQRRQLLADISHELATPLTSIQGYTETLLEPGVPVSDEERAAFLGNILEESQRMDLLIQDLLDLTRLESGAIVLENVRLDWTELCRNTADRFRARFEKAGLGIQWPGASEPAWVLADGRRMEQVLENLLINALRYVPSGGTVTLSLEPVSEGAGNRFRLIVNDDGPGFPPEDLPHIFDRFYRADAARSSAGSGLGLAIVKEIVSLHGGGVRAENRGPRGAAIIVELPAEI